MEIQSKIKTFPEQPLTFIKTDKNTVEISANNGKKGCRQKYDKRYKKARDVLSRRNTNPKLKTNNKANNLSNGEHNDSGLESFLMDASLCTTYIQS